jgi:hypothetical protein
MSETDNNEGMVRIDQGEAVKADDSPWKDSPWNGIITAVDSVQQALGNCPAAAKAMGISLNSVDEMAAIFRRSKGLAEKVAGQTALLQEAEEDLANAQSAKEAMESRHDEEYNDARTVEVDAIRRVSAAKAELHDLRVQQRRSAEMLENDIWEPNSR